MGKNEDKISGMTSEPGELHEQAATMIKTLWSNGVIVSHPEEMLHTDGLHRLAPKPQIGDQKAAQMFKQMLPGMLAILQGILPKDAKVNS